MKILIVGAGAVGQVFGRHLAAAGAEVSFFVKKKYVAESAQGFKLYPLNRRHPRVAPVEFDQYSILTELEQVRATHWDQVYLCMSSTGLQSGWFEEFAKAIPEATLVTLQPGVDDREYLLRFFPEVRLVTGVIFFISYYAPLPGENVREPGIAYWVPPLRPSPFSGPGGRAQSVVSILNKGHLPAVVHENVRSEGAFPGAALMAMLTALELSDWSLDKLTHNGLLPQACSAASEAVGVMSRKLAAKPPFGFRLVRPVVLRTVLKVAPKLVPFDLETYLKMHFTKVNDQTRLIMKGYIDHGKQLKVPVNMLESLERKIRRSSAVV